MSEEILGANEPEFAELDDKGAEEQEVAEPEVETEDITDKNTPDEAWAEMRRARQDAENRAAEAERELAELKAENNAKAAAMKKIGGSEDAEINALAQSLGLEPEDIMATLEAEQQAASKDLEIERLKAELASINADKEMQKDLISIQKIDPSVKDLNELGDSYGNYIKAGLTAEEAYFACKRQEAATKATPPAEIGKLNNETVKKDSFTEAEVAAMSEDEIRNNYEAIIKASAEWKGR